MCVCAHGSNWYAKVVECSRLSADFFTEFLRQHICVCPQQQWVGQVSIEVVLPSVSAWFRSYPVRLDCFYMDATGPRSGSGFWRRKTCRLDFVKVKESAASPAQLLHWRCSRFTGRFLHIEFIL